MKVKELIEQLSKQDPEAEVRILSKNHKSWMPVTEHIANVEKSPYNEWVLVEGV